MAHSGRSEVLAEADLAILRHLADAVLAETAVRVHKPPAAELTHMQFRELVLSFDRADCVIVDV